MFTKIIVLFILCFALSSCNKITKKPLVTPTSDITNTFLLTSIPNLTPTTTITTGVPSLSFTKTPTGVSQDWNLYKNMVYGFSCYFPQEWKVSDLNIHLIQISSSEMPDIKLTIGVRWATEDAMIQRTGVPEGDLITVGNILFLGQEISKEILEYQGKDKKILYAKGFEIRRGDRIFTLGVDEFTIYYDAIDLPNSIEETADSIIESFTLIL